MTVLMDIMKSQVQELIWYSGIAYKSVLSILNILLINSSLL